MVKWQSSATPRFLTDAESDMGTDALPMVIESGMEAERDQDFLPEDTIIASVLSLSLFTVIQVLTQHTSAWRGGDLRFDEGPQMSGVDKHRRMSGEGQSAFQ